MTQSTPTQSLYKQGDVCLLKPVRIMSAGSEHRHSEEFRFSAYRIKFESGQWSTVTDIDFEPHIEISEGSHPRSYKGQVALAFARRILALDEHTFPGGANQKLARIQVLIEEAIEYINALSSE